MRIRLSVLFLTMFLLQWPCLCQSPSFQIATPYQNQVANGLAVNGIDEIVGVFGEKVGPHRSKYFVQFDNNGTGIENAVRLSIDSLSIGKFVNAYSDAVKYLGSRAIIYSSVYETQAWDVLVAVDLASNTYWGKGYKVVANSIDYDAITTSNEIIVATAKGDTLALQKLNASTGQDIWSKGFLKFNHGFNPDSSYTNKVKVRLHASGSIFVAETYQGYYDYNRSECYITKLDQHGTPTAQIGMGIGYQFTQPYMAQDALYMLGNTNLPFPFTSNQSNLVLAKLDTNLTLLWTKLFYADDFEFNKASLSISPNGTLNLGYSTFGYFPTILAKLDTAGNILWQKGYPLFEPELDMLSDGSLLMLSRQKNQPIDLTSRTIVAKTDTMGDIQNCQTFPTCLYGESIQLPTSSYDVMAVPHQMFYDTVFDMHITPAEFTFADYCEYPTPPIAEFSAPDTICLEDSIIAIGLGNEYAHGIEWELTGNGLSIVLEDSTSFANKFNTAGTYRLIQTIWYLGCRHSSEKNIVVLPPLEAAIVSDGTFCTPPTTLKLQANRPVLDFIWSTNETAHEIMAAYGGTYSVTATDGYCAFADTVEVAFVSAQLNGKPPFTLPPDTLVCPDALPFSLTPQSDFTDMFAIKHETPQPPPVKLESEGDYTISTTIGGCEFEETYSIGLKDCEPKIYFPNAFSPNGDGINDVFSPQGTKFTALKLLVFDRWGDLVHQAEGSVVGWSPVNAAQGVYTYLFEFLATETGKVGKTQGSVNLIR